MRGQQLEHAQLGRGDRLGLRAPLESQAQPLRSALEHADVVFGLEGAECASAPGVGGLELADLEKALADDHAGKHRHPGHRHHLAEDRRDRRRLRGQRRVAGARQQSRLGQKQRQRAAMAAEAHFGEALVGLPGGFLGVFPPALFGGHQRQQSECGDLDDLVRGRSLAGGDLQVTHGARLDAREPERAAEVELGLGVPVRARTVLELRGKLRIAAHARHPLRRQRSAQQGLRRAQRHGSVGRRTVVDPGTAGGRHPGARRLPVADRRIDPTGGQGERDAGQDLLATELPEHAAYGLTLTASPEACPTRGDLVGGAPVVAGLEQMDDAARHIALVEVPLPRLAAEPGDRVGIAPGKLGPQELAEELVVAKPLVAVVFGRDEEVLVGEPRKHGLGVVTSGDGVTERRREAFQHRGLQKELLRLVVLAREHFAEEIAVDLAQVAAHRHRPLAGRPAARGQRSQGQSRRPALGRTQQDVEIVHGK